MGRLIEIFTNRLRRNPDPDPFSKIPLVEHNLRSVVWKSHESAYTASSVTIDERDGIHFSATYVKNGMFQEVKLDKNPDETFTRRITTPRTPICTSRTNFVQMYGTVKDLISPEEAREVMQDSVQKAWEMKNLI